MGMRMSQFPQLPFALVIRVIRSRWVHVRQRFSRSLPSRSSSLALERGSNNRPTRVVVYQWFQGQRKASSRHFVYRGNNIWIILCAQRSDLKRYLFLRFLSQPGRSLPLSSVPCSETGINVLVLRSKVVLGPQTQKSQLFPPNGSQTVVGDTHATHRQRS